MEDDGDSTVCTRGALVCFSSLKKFFLFFFLSLLKSVSSLVVYVCKVAVVSPLS